MAAGIVNETARATKNRPGMTLEWRRRTRRFGPGDHRVVAAG